MRTSPNSTFQFVENITLKQTLEKLCTLKNLDPIRYIQNHGIEYRHLGAPEKQSLVALAKIADDFDMNIQDLISGKIDYEWIKNPTLPKKYYKSKGSRMRTSLVPLNFVKNNCGKKCFDFVRRSLKIPLSIITQPNLEVSVELLQDILNLFSLMGISEDDFSKIGQHIVHIEENKQIGLNFKSLVTPQEVFEKLFDDMILKYEKNFKYTIIKSHARSLEVEVSQKEQLSYDLKKNFLNDPLLSQYRFAACAAHLEFSNLGRAQAVQLPGRNPEQEKFEIFW